MEAAITVKDTPMTVTVHLSGEPHKLFCYGTLKRGGRLHHALADASFVGNTTIHGRLYIPKNHWYPAVVHGNEIVHGELYDHLTGALLERLDALEGHPFLFKREKIKTGACVDAWVYLYTRSLAHAQHLESGVFEVKQ